MSETGRACLKWDNQLIYEMGHYGLSGKHSYCRNPRSDGEKPWCYVSINDRIQKEICNIPECGKYSFEKYKKLLRFYYRRKRVKMKQ